MGWSTIVELLAVLAVFAVLAPVAWLFIRRRWLSSQGPVFDCALRLHPDDPSSGWRLGLAHYVGDSIEWYRIFSLSLRPQLVLQRRRVQIRGRRMPDAQEQVALFADHTIVRLEQINGAGHGACELAMPAESVTGLMSWLEAAPPRGDAYSRD